MQPQQHPPISIIHSYLTHKRLLLIIGAPPLFLFSIYFILGGLALFMFLMGMSAVLALLLFSFHNYFDYEKG